tara:strand:- start:75 stop:215 length:141 start_codon:yes stop_codon:yes gene_type:complete
MQNIKLTEKSFFKEERGISLIETSRLLADFFNGVVVEVEEEYVYES